MNQDKKHLIGATRFKDRNSSKHEPHYCKLSLDMPEETKKDFWECQYTIAETNGIILSSGRGVGVDALHSIFVALNRIHVFFKKDNVEWCCVDNEALSAKYAFPLPVSYLNDRWSEGILCALEDAKVVSVNEHHKDLQTRISLKKPKEPQNDE
ncbi:MAG: DUF6968 family protein [Opitutales bacterium]